MGLALCLRTSKNCFCFDGAKTVLDHKRYGLKSTSKSTYCHIMQFFSTWYLIQQSQYFTFHFNDMLIDQTYFSFPKIGERPIITEANADFTCWLASDTKSFTQGRMLVIITLSRTSADKFWQKSTEMKKNIMNHVKCIKSSYFVF